MSLKSASKRASSGRLRDHDTSKTLSDPGLVFRAFLDCLKEGDSGSALEVLSAGLRHLNKSKIERKYRIPRRTVYNLLSKKSTPGLDVVARLCRAIQQESGERMKSA